MSGADEIPVDPRTGYVCLGVIGGAHGLKGDLWVKSYTETPDGIAAYGPVWDLKAGRSYGVRVVGGDGERIRVHLHGVDDRTAAEALRGRELSVPRSALPAPDADEFYHVDLIGLDVFVDQSAADGSIGRIAAVHDFGAGTVLELRRPEAAIVMIPFTRDAVPVVDLAGGRLVVAELPGLFEDAVDPARAGRFSWEPGDIEFIDRRAANDRDDDAGGGAR